MHPEAFCSGTGPVNRFTQHIVLTGSWVAVNRDNATFPDPPPRMKEERAMLPKDAVLGLVNRATLHGGWLYHVSTLLGVFLLHCTVVNAL